MISIPVPAQPVALKAALSLAALAALVFQAGATPGHAATAPTVNDDFYSTPIGALLNVPAPGVLANDGPDPASLTVISWGGLTPSAAGTLAVQIDGSLTFNPAIGFEGDAIFVYRAVDGAVISSNATVTLSVTSANLPPVADTGGPYAVGEGSSVTLDATGSSDPDFDPLSFAWDLDEDGVFGETGEFALRGDETGVSPVFDASMLDGPYVAQIALRVSDGNGGMTDASSTVNVANVAPTIAASGESQTLTVSTTGAGTVIEVTAGETVTIGPISFTDPAVADTHSAVFDWGDGSASDGAVTESGGAGTVSGSHIYLAAGTYEVTLTLVDDDGGSAVKLFQVFVTAGETGELRGSNNRMTGTGVYVVHEPGSRASRVTWNFKIKCDGSRSRFFIRDRGARNWFSLRSTESVVCSDDPSINPGQRRAAFDTLTLTGAGRWNGKPGATIRLTVTDGGEPGMFDTLHVSIWDESGKLQFEIVVDSLAGGNHQARTQDDSHGRAQSARAGDSEGNAGGNGKSSESGLVAATRSHRS